MEPTQRRATLAAFLGLFALVLGLLLWTVSSFLLALFMGQLLALLTEPLHRALTRKLGGRPRAAALLTAGLTGLCALAPLAVIGALAAREALQVGERLSAGGAILPRVARALEPARAWIGPGAEARLRLQTQAAAHEATLRLLAWLRGLPHFGLELLLAFVALYFLLLEGDRALRLVFAPLPLEPAFVDSLVAIARDTATSTVWAALAAASVEMSALTAAMLVMRVPLAFLCGGLAFIAAWVPLVSSAPLWLGAAAYLWAHDAPVRGAVLLGLGGLTYGLDQLVRPLVLRGRARLHPLFALVSLLGGLVTFGLLGVFVGPVIAALTAALYEVWPELAARSGIRPAVGPLKRGPAA